MWKQVSSFKPCLELLEDRYLLDASAVFAAAAQYGAALPQAPALAAAATTVAPGAVAAAVVGSAGPAASAYLAGVAAGAVRAAATQITQSGVSNALKAPALSVLTALDHLDTTADLLQNGMTPTPAVPVASVQNIYLGILGMEYKAGKETTTLLLDANNLLKDIQVAMLAGKASLMALLNDPTIQADIHALLTHYYDNFAFSVGNDAKAAAKDAADAAEAWASLGGSGSGGAVGGGSQTPHTQGGHSSITYNENAPGGPGGGHGAPMYVNLGAVTVR